MGYFGNISINIALHAYQTLLVQIILQSNPLPSNLPNKPNKLDMKRRALIKWNY